MSFIATNLKRLRVLKGFNQDVVAFAAGFTKYRLRSFELGLSEPRASELVKLSDYYQVFIDALIRTDLEAMPRSEVERLQRQFPNPPQAHGH